MHSPTHATRFMRRSTPEPRGPHTEAAGRLLASGPSKALLAAELKSFIEQPGADRALEPPHGLQQGSALRSGDISVDYNITKLTVGLQVLGGDVEMASRE